ncbi:MAG: aminoacetone oxidase family FAD-binding enzyme [Clostridia bacterium]|nr:aminoacetone oxidase family FAD-binding enzyme [Clostridia bacterium]
MVNDLIIVGGGASGLCAAVYFKQKYPNSTVRILEALPRVGKKLALTGNGRCNITNKNINLSRYHGKDTEFCRYALDKYDVGFTKEFFEKIGVEIIFEEDKAYPSSFQASSVVDCLRFACDELGVITHTETPVTDIQISNGNYRVISNQMSFLSKNLIIATGGLAGGERLGCDGKMFNILKKADFKVAPQKPTIVQIKTETDIVKQLKGIKINAVAKLGSRSDFGEVLFCDYGLSGPAILQISREASYLDKPQITLDIIPDINFNELCELLTNRVNSLKERTLDEFFTGMLQKRVGQVLLKQIGCKLIEKVSTLDIKKIKALAAIMKKWEFAVTGTTGFSNAQATAGGLATKEFNNETMENKSTNNLYCIGEILDVDGDCGGFNLQWAWSSAFCAVDALRNV